MEEGIFGKEELKVFGLYTAIGQALAWLIVAPMLDILLYKEPVNLVFTQGAIAFVMDLLCAVIIGALLLKAYASTRTGKGTLTKND